MKRLIELFQFSRNELFTPQIEIFGTEDDDIAT